MQQRPGVPMQQLPQRPQVIARTPIPANGQSDPVMLNVEHVFTDKSGKQVRKMPVDINGETVWVECVDQQNYNGSGDVIMDPGQDFNTPTTVTTP